MVDWEVTATTIYCDAVADEVTVMVYGDGTVKCTGFQKYMEPSPDTVKIMEQKGRKLGKKLACEGASCTKVARQRELQLGKK